jgi:carboxyl-terminal processing protease
MSESGIAWWLGQHLLITTALAAIVFLICRVVRLSPATRHILWLLVMCRLMVPSVVTWPWAIQVSTDDTSTASAFSHVDSTAADVVNADVMSSESSAVVSMSDAVAISDSVADDSGADNVIEDQHLEMAEQRIAGGLVPIAWRIVGLWCIGSLLVALILLHRIRRVGQLLQDESAVDAWLRNEISDLCCRLSVHVPKCVVSRVIRSPFLWCLGRVRLVWPLAASRSEQREQVRPILVHELAHLKRRDHWTAWLELVALTIWWWNPIFWFVRRQMRAAAEMACDAWVVELLPNQRRAYAESLIEFSGRGQTSQLVFGAVGADTGSRRLFKRRLEMIMTDDAAARLSMWTACSAVALALVSLPAFALEPVPRANDAEDTTSGVSDSEDQTQDSESDSNDADPNQPAAAQQRTVEVTKKLVVTSTLDGTAVGTVADGSASLNEVLSRIEKQYYGHINRNELERAAIEAIMSKLDDRSSVLTREEYERMAVSVDGNLVGVGIAIHLDSDTGQPVVTRPIRNSPGIAAGLRRNDVIVSVDGKPTDGQSLSEIVRQIRGPRGSAITLGIQRADEKLDVKVVRERFETSVVNPMSVSADGREDYWANRESGIGYVHIPAFTKHTVSQLQKVLAGLHDDNMKGLVLDLRDCGGGLLTAATKVVDMFIDEGVILSSQGRGEEEHITFQAKAGGEYTDLPLVILMNGFTASAAEIVAASLQDHNRAAMVGEQTYGRGTVQSLFRLQDGSALKLTTAAWMRPNGKTLIRREGKDDWGVQPDPGRAIALSEDVHKQLAHQRQHRLSGEDITTPVDDPQLDKAIDVLRRG